MAASEHVRVLLQRLRAMRERAGVSPAQLEERLILGPGWVERFESGQTAPSVDTLLAMVHAVGGSLDELVRGLAAGADSQLVERQVFAERDGEDVLVKFAYADHDATYRLQDATIDEFEKVLKVMRDGLARLAGTSEAVAQAIKTDAVAKCFLAAVQTWPHINPSDLWWFIVSRAYGDPFNHPARFARLDLGQSWKRTAGWALEEVVVRHYGPFLAKHGVRMFIARGPEKARLVGQFKVRGRVETDKVDVLLTGNRNGKEVCFGVVHVKASFAERRTDDVPLSGALVEAGYLSPLWTMDCKSTPSAEPVNRGELGAVLTASGDERSAKRKDIEDDGYFSACFSYNKNTRPTPAGQRAKAQVFVCDFSNPDDAFSRFVLEFWKNFTP